ncbi:MAG: hypothetical protein ACI9YT_002281 [Halobacteriales archaeon]|jgi:hypothetical protein
MNGDRSINRTGTGRNFIGTNPIYSAATGESDE